MFVRACFSMNSVERAVTLCGTSCRFSLRRVAVTVTGSSRVGSCFAGGCSWARAWAPGYSVAKMAAASGVFWSIIRDPPKSSRHPDKAI